MLRFAALTTTLALAVTLFTWLQSPWFPPYDDAFITLTSAQAVWSGRISNFPEAAPLHGVTSPVHCLLVALLLLVCSAPLTALWVSQLLSTLLYGFGLWRVSASLLLAERIAVVVTGYVAGSVWHQLSNGLETGLAMACAVWMLVGLREKRWWLAILLGSAPYIRPEFGALSAAIGFSSIWQNRRDAWPFIALVALAAMPWAVWLWWDVGQPIQTSVQVKGWIESARLAPWANRGAILAQAATAFALICGPVCAGIFALRRFPHGSAVAVGLALVAVGYANSQPMLVLDYHAQRYVYPLLSFALGGFAMWLKGNANTTERVIALATVLLYSLLAMPSNATPIRTWRAHVAVEFPSLVSSLQPLPVGTVVAVGDAGYPAYATKYPLVDIIGLKTPTAARVHRDITAPSRGRDLGYAVEQILVEHGTRVLIVWDGWDKGVGFVARLRERGWQIKDLRPDRAHPLGQYRVVSGTPPDGSTSGPPRRRKPPLAASERGAEPPRSESQ